jgi:F-type H+-transporting ATPase subunit delta
VAGEELAAKRYARAILELGLESDADLEAWAGAIDSMAEFMSDAEVRRVLENSRVARADKLHLIEAALNELPPRILNLARLLVQKSRTNLATQIADVFRSLVAEQAGIVYARAITAVPLSDSERDNLVSRLALQTGNRVALETEVDPNILGGLVIQMGDKLIDASTRARLQSLRENLVGAF